MNLMSTQATIPGFVRRLVQAAGAVLLLTSGLPAGANAAEFRGLWVDAWGPDLWTASGVSNVVSNARSANFNALVCQVRRRADSLYRITPFEPVCTDVAASYDPLADLIARGHDTSAGKQRLEIHAWLVAYHAWGGTTNAPPAGHPYLLHPDWLMLDSGSNALQTFDPGHPQVQQQVFNVAMNILTNYDVDGLNLDYIRYSSASEGYNSNSVARFNRQTGRTGTPAPEDEVWKQWRRDQVTALLRKIYLNAISVRPAVKVSCDTVTWSPAPVSDASWTNARPYREVLQDWRAWMEEGLMDLNLPMCYFRAYDPGQASDFGTWRDFILGHQYSRYAVIGPAAFLNAIPDTISQMRQEQGTSGQGICVNGYKVTNKDALPRSEFINALVSPSSYDPISPAIFAQQASVPTMPWKSAPTKGHLKGSLYGGSTANPLDGAAFTLDGPVHRGGISDATAFYGSVDLPPGSYTLNASFEGFAPVSTNLSISAGVVTTVDLILPTLAAGTRPAILAQPHDTAACVGSEAGFSVTATGTTPLAYQWFANSSPLAGATRSALAVTNVQTTTAATYFVRVTNSFGLSNSATVLLTVTGAPPVVLASPQSQTAIAGNNATLSVSAGGSTPITYQWWGPGSQVGDSSPTLVLSNVQPSQAGSYYVRLTNAFGAATSSVALLTINFALATPTNGAGTVTRSPVQDSYASGSLVTLTANPATNANFVEWSGDASGADNPLTVRMTNNLTVVANFSQGATVADIVIDNTNAQAFFYGSWQTGSNSGKYGPDYRFTSGCLAGVSNALFVPNLPMEGRYDVYVWYVEGSNRATNALWTIYWNGGTDTCYVNQQTNGAQWVKIASARPFAAGTNGYVRLSNQIGVSNKVVMADAVRFAYVAPPFISSGPQSQTIVVGQGATFSVTASGADALSYLWKKNGNVLAAPNAPSLSLPSARFADAGIYGVTVSNYLGSVTLGNAGLNVLPVQIQSFAPLTNGLRQFQINWASSNTVIEASSDFSNWLELQRLTWNTNLIQAQESNTNASSRFYRTKLP
jgi:uncharacterized lipoprotein YddW (UPF0748 family)